MKDQLKKLWEMISFRTLWDQDEEDDWEDFDTREDYISGSEGRKHASPVRNPLYVWLAVAALCAAAIVGWQAMSRRHLYTSYKKTASWKGEDISGTSYVRLGSDFVKYGADGVTLVNASNETLWSNAYTMQATASDQCGKSILIYELQGNQVLVADKSGVIGQYQTDLPILKGSVASNGVSAFLLKNDSDVLIRLYSPDGSTLAEVKPTLERTGQPIALDLSENATRLMVSAAKVGSGTVDAEILFYDFSSASESEEKHVTGNISYTDELFGEVFFADNRTPVAVANDRFIVFTGTKDPKERANVEITGEISSVFHDEDHVGFVCLSDDAANRYELSVYTMRGKQTMDTLFNEGYQSVVLDSGEILLWSQRHMMSYTPGGVKRFDSDFDQKIGLFAKIPGFRRYCILSNSGITRIKAE